MPVAAAAAAAGNVLALVLIAVHKQAADAG